MGIVKVESTKNNVVTRSNKLVRAKLQMPDGATYGLTEKRFLLWVISCVEPQDKKLQTYELPLNEFAELAQIPRQNVYQMIKKICLNVMALTWEIKEYDDKGKEISTMVSVVYKAVHKEGAGITEVTIHEDMAPHLLNQQGNFTSLKLVDFMPLRSKHALSLYEEVKIEQWKRKTQHIDIIKLRDIFSLQDGQYKEFHNFEARVLKPAVQEINGKTDVHITYAKVKTGRRVTAIDFLVKAQANERNKVEVLPPASKELNNEVEKLVHYGVTQDVAVKLFKQDPEQVKKSLKLYENDPSQAKDPARYLVASIKGKWIDTKEIQAKNKEEEKEEAIRRQIREFLEQTEKTRKQEIEQAYQKANAEIIENIVVTWSASEEKKYWKEASEIAENSLLSHKLYQTKGKDRWTSMFNRQDVKEYLAMYHNTELLTHDEFKVQYERNKGK